MFRGCVCEPLEMFSPFCTIQSSRNGISLENGDVYFETSIYPFLVCKSTDTDLFLLEMDNLFFGQSKAFLVLP